MIFFFEFQIYFVVKKKMIYFSYIGLFWIILLNFNINKVNKTLNKNIPPIHPIKIQIVNASEE